VILEATVTQALKPLSAIPTDRDSAYVSHIREEGKFPKTTYIAVFEHSDCIREFDGSTWRIVKDKRPGADVQA
jgi:hypothetical protein